MSEISKELKEQIEKDIKESKERIAAKDKEDAVDKAKKEAKEEAKKELETEKTIEELKKSQEEADKRIQEQEEKIKAQEEEYKKKIDAMVESQAVVTQKNPFADNPSSGGQVDPKQVIKRMTDEQVNDIEQKSREAFLQHLQNKR